MSKCFKVLALILGCVSYGILFQVFYLQRSLPSQLYVLPGQSIYLENGRVEVEEVFSSIEVEKNISLGEARLMGFFPIKSIVLKEIERPWLVPCGEPFGIKMLTQGAMVIGIGLFRPLMETKVRQKKAD